MVFCSKNGSKRGFSEKKYGTNRVFGGVKYSKSYFGGIKMKLSEIFRDGMVLQHGKPIRIFGEAQGDVYVAFGGKGQTVKADGKWLEDELYSTR